jgi:hypothetical protein
MTVSAMQGRQRYRRGLGQRKSRPQGGQWKPKILIYLKKLSAWARRLFTSSQFTTFHQAFR